MVIFKDSLVNRLYKYVISSIKEKGGFIEAVYINYKIELIKMLKFKDSKMLFYKATHKITGRSIILDIEINNNNITRRSINMDLKVLDAFLYYGDNNGGISWLYDWEDLKEFEELILLGDIIGIYIYNHLIGYDRKGNDVVSFLESRLNNLIEKDLVFTLEEIKELEEPKDEEELEYLLCNKYHAIDLGYYIDMEDLHYRELSI